MFRRIVITSVLVVVISLLFGERAKELLTTIIGVVLFKSHSPSTTKANLFTPADLKLYNGIDKPELYLAILGNVFDVTKGFKHYGPNQQYNSFVGRDASRSFITGRFTEEDLIEEVADLKPHELISLNNWLKFYRKEYKLVGKLIGKYFDDQGMSTPYRKVVNDLITKAELEKDKEDTEKAKFPPCNVEWDAESGTKVWCSERSGGISRDWAGVPRQLYEAGSQSYRCACINEENQKLGNIKEYEGCDKHSNTCFVQL